MRAERAPKELSPQYLFFPQTESQCNRTFPTVWCTLRMRERPAVGFQKTRVVAGAAMGRPGTMGGAVGGVRSGAPGNTRSRACAGGGTPGEGAAETLVQYYFRGPGL